MKTQKTIFHKIASLFLAAVMVVTLFTAANPTEAQAAGLSFKGKGTSSVTIKDEQCKEGDAYAVHYIKYKPSVTGTVTLKFTAASSLYNYSYGTVTFCNKNKKAIGQTNEYWSNENKDQRYYVTTYGVKKNQTYYFAVKCDGGTKITATTKSIKDQSKSSKAKAVNLAKGKTATGVIAYGDGKADWYKFNLTSAKLSLRFAAQTNGDNASNGIKVTFYDKDGKVFTGQNKKAISNLTRSNPEGGWNVYMSGNGSNFDLGSGTYYVKVERLSKASSGSYTLKWTTY